MKSYGKGKGHKYAQATVKTPTHKRALRQNKKRARREWAAGHFIRYYED